jgi:ElaA protein
VTSAAAPAWSWTWGRFDALTNHDVYDLLALRSQVFVVEQQCVFLDADTLDHQAWHLLARHDPTASRDGHAALGAYLRCIDAGIKYDEPSIGRVIVSPGWRATGMGRSLMIEGIGRTRAIWPGRAIRIGAQARLERFYASLGFRREGSPYDEDGIEHVEMVLAPESAAIA